MSLRSRDQYAELAGFKAINSASPLVDAACADQASGRTLDSGDLVPDTGRVPADDHVLRLVAVKGERVWRQCSCGLVLGPDDFDLVCRAFALYADYRHDFARLQRLSDFERRDMERELGRKARARQR